ncbi:single-stranded DNA-binding protein [Leifsonia sp. PS1209]|uniref:single-stranded DNA-binding protein n=1 Tax=Leifsonia sp. PS1209 TaxID=2724914 RepID=UPI001442A887|nr:single-stranded DNA-binding protein [Leifsonia sp. PS1209]QIZ98610.1 single-stranded DNA-binding protein [Leifsonia sp. PS1209]
MNDTITVTGVVATDPRHIVTTEGLSVTSFRLISTNTVYDVDADAWQNTRCNWFTVSAYRQLASNVAGCVSRGDPVLVTGRLTVREWSDGDDTSSRGITAEIEADAIGHDLAWGSATFARTVQGVRAVDVPSATAV